MEARRSVLDETDLLRNERSAIAAARGIPSNEPWCGIALSGGGIRSATFCLGALQRLAKAKLLQHFDYMSSVSGGGYMAASMQWIVAHDPKCDTGESFPYGVSLSERTSPGAARLDELRSRASYLAPGEGISVWSLVATVVRTVLLSLLVWIPFFTLGMWLLIAVAIGVISVLPDWLAQSLPRPKGLIDEEWAFAIFWACVAALLTALLILLATVLVFVATLVPPDVAQSVNAPQRIAKRALIAGVCGIAGGLIVWGLRSYALGPISQAVKIVCLMLVIFSIFAFGVAANIWLRRPDREINYQMRRLVDRAATWLFPIILLSLALASLPIVTSTLRDAPLLRQYSGLSGIFGALAALSGVASALYGHFVQAQRVAPNLASRVTANAAGGLFIYGLVLFSFVISDAIIRNPENIFGERVLVAFMVALVCGVTFGQRSNVNYLGLHRFYRDRLMEAFLPRFPGAEPDRTPLSQLWKPDAGKAVSRPYPIFNTNAVLINDDDPTVRLRGGASFILSPLYIGSAETGWIKTEENDSTNAPLTTASAMAASGAALNANAAYAGAGVTRDRLISIVMTLLNTRLGLWIGTPGKVAGPPNYFRPAFEYGVLSFLRTGYRRDSRYMELTDGGHFENLGVYELIRRRLDLIVAFDSEEDPATTMYALASLCQRVFRDFGVTIEIGDKANALMPTDFQGYPGGAKISKRSYFVAPIKYPGRAPNASDKNVPVDSAKTGYFIYIKSNMVDGLSFPSKGYKARNPDFPNQSTMDQFFEPDQFEAYRDLGFACVEAMLRDLKIDGADRTAMIASVSKSMRQMPAA